MSKTIISSTPSVIPRFVRNLNSLAEAVDMLIEVLAVAGEEGAQLHVRWTGTKPQLLALGLIPPSQRQLLSSTQRRLRVPDCWRNPLLDGECAVRGERVCWELEFGPAEFEIDQHGGVEVISRADGTLYHGSAAELLELGIPRARLALKKRGGLVVNDGVYSKCRRQPDGTLVFFVASYERCLLAWKRNHGAWVASLPADSRRRIQEDRNAEQYADEDWLFAVEGALEGKPIVRARRAVADLSS